MAEKNQRPIYVSRFLLEYTSTYTIFVLFFFRTASATATTFQLLGVG